MNQTILESLARGRRSLAFCRAVTEAIDSLDQAVDDMPPPAWKKSPLEEKFEKITKEYAGLIVTTTLQSSSNPRGAESQVGDLLKKYRLSLAEADSRTIETAPESRKWAERLVGTRTVAQRLLESRRTGR